jgi:glycosyltransferase involved in cell wall biosynthesis
LSSEDVVFASVGSIRPNKGLERLIGAFQTVAGANLRLIITGKPWPPEEYVLQLESLASQDPRITYLPQMVPDEDLQNYFSAADAVVLPFERVLTSSSTVLAMSFGKPVIAPALGCLPELVAPGCGLLYEPTTPHALSTALQQCVELDLPAMGKNARHRVEQFTWGDMAQATLRAYRGSDGDS